jgi:hypothetical protein
VFPRGPTSVKTEFHCEGIGDGKRLNLTRPIVFRDGVRLLWWSSKTEFCRLNKERERGKEGGRKRERERKGGGRDTHVVP